jgi:hypothetical protein
MSHVISKLHIDAMFVIIFFMRNVWICSLFVYVPNFTCVQCVHKVPSGFWKIVARKQIELATRGLRQITVKLWKFFCRQQMTWWPEDPYQECDLGYSSGQAPQNMARARISSGLSPCYQGSPHRGLLRSAKNFQSFTVICRKPHVASSICLRATNFQNPEGTLWTHCILWCIYIILCD